MSAEGFSPECTLNAHQLCAGTKTIRRQGAPAWEAPILRLRCDCRCHRGRQAGTTR